MPEMNHIQTHGNIMVLKGESHTYHIRRIWGGGGGEDCLLEGGLHGHDVEHLLQIERRWDGSRDKKGLYIYIREIRERRERE